MISLSTRKNAESVSDTSDRRLDDSEGQQDRDARRAGQEDRFAHTYTHTHTVAVLTPDVGSATTSGGKTVMRDAKGKKTGTTIMSW